MNAGVVPIDRRLINNQLQSCSDVKSSRTVRPTVRIRTVRDGRWPANGCQPGRKAADSEQRIRQCPTWKSDQRGSQRLLRASRRADIPNRRPGGSSACRYTLVRLPSRTLHTASNTEPAGRMPSGRRADSLFRIRRFSARLAPICLAIALGSLVSPSDLSRTFRHRC